jgi:hypothetical protein
MKTKKSIFQAVDNSPKDGIAIEALIQAEDQFMRNDFSKEDLNEIKKTLNTEGFDKMAYKDDDGYWRVTGILTKYNTIESLQRDFPSLV